MHDAFRGDNEYCIDCTGNVVVGDEVRFDKAIFKGSYRRPKFVGFERITGRVIKDSYGKAKQQHTFTLLLEDGSKMLIKGRNLYRHGVFRKPWPDEGARRAAEEEKWKRGEAAREAREARKLKDDYWWLYR